MLERFARLALFVSIGVVLLACSPAAVASLLPAAAGPLVTVTTHGGECMDGPCGSTIVIEREGRMHQTAPSAAELGTVPAEVLSTLNVAIKATDFGVIRSRPFTGECPVAFDGQEVIYEFGAPTGVERIASCETEIDADNPVFAATTAALAAASAIPNP
jgi:hypothetical protein